MLLVSTTSSVPSRKNKNLINDKVSHTSAIYTGKPVAEHEMLDKVALINDATVFVCAASGWPPPQYTWFKDGKILNLTSSNLQLRKEQNAQHLMILHAGYLDAGKYTCRVSNALGSIELSSQLKVVKYLSEKPDSPGTQVIRNRI
jgi:hypothetical protein